MFLPGIVLIFIRNNDDDSNYEKYSIELIRIKTGTLQSNVPLSPGASFEADPAAALQGRTECLAVDGV